MCHKVECSEDKGSYKVIIYPDSQTLNFTCEKEGDKSPFRVGDARIICHDPAKICGKTTNCPSDCYNRYGILEKPN